MTDIWGTPRDDEAAARPARLLIARHGVTEWNARRVWQGRRDVPLTDEGRAQARALAERLRGEAVDAIVTSDLSRARETAEIVGAALGVGIRATSLLREIDVGAWEGLSPRDIAAREPAAAAALERGEDLPRGGSGETLAGFAERVASGLREACAAAPGGTLLIVAHGGVNKMIVAHLIGLPVRNVGRLTSGGNAALSEVRFTERGAQLLRLNCAHHVVTHDVPPTDA